MSTHPARSLWHSMEIVHDVTYFAPEVRDTGLRLGLKGFWMTYFAFRAAPLGPVGPGVVTATFAGFHPDWVSKALPAAWDIAGPSVCLDARAEVAARVLRAVGVTDEVADRSADALAPVAAGADPTGRPLYAANAEVAPPADPVARLWQLTATLREHRGDGHIAAYVAAGLSGMQAQLLQVAAGHYPAELVRGIRGWSEAEWTAGVRQLAERGLLDGSGAFTDAGRALLDGIESRTDELAWAGGLARLGEDGAAEVVELMRPAVHAVSASGVLPRTNPTGVPLPTETSA